MKLIQVFYVHRGLKTFRFSTECLATKFTQAIETPSKIEHKTLTIYDKEEEIPNLINEVERQKVLNKLSYKEKKLLGLL